MSWEREEAEVMGRRDRDCDNNDIGGRRDRCRDERRDLERCLAGARDEECRRCCRRCRCRNWWDDDNDDIGGRRDRCRDERRDLERCLAGARDEECRRCCRRCRCRNNQTTWGR